jgi:hypothetical protein
MRMSVNEMQIASAPGPRAALYTRTDSINSRLRVERREAIRYNVAPSSIRYWQPFDSLPCKAAVP